MPSDKPLSAASRPHPALGEKQDRGKSGIATYIGRRVNLYRSRVSTYIGQPADLY